MQLSAKLKTRILKISIFISFPKPPHKEANRQIPEFINKKIKRLDFVKLLQHFVILMMNQSKIRENLESWFSTKGFIFLGIVDLDVRKDFLKFKQWLASGNQGSMEYLANHLELRENPAALIDKARSAVIFGFPYYQDKEKTLDEGHGRIAQYARLKDYHKFMKLHAQHIIDKITEDFPNDSFKIAVDSTPILERALAKKTSRGFIGKNTCYIHPNYGSFLLLGEIITSIQLDADTPANITPEMRTDEGGCGSCKRCQVHCPTGALDQDYQLNANKCISYWTIENRDIIPKEFWPWLKDYVFGCDLCQLVCPYNRKISPIQTRDLQKSPASVDLYGLATISQEDYEKRFGGTPITRAKRYGLRRNALVAMYVNNDKRLLKAISAVKLDSHPVLEKTIDQMELA